MTSKEQLGIGIIGLGWPGQRHAEAIEATEKARLTAVADLDSTRRETTSEKYPAARVYIDYEDLLENPDVDAVVVCLPNFLHFPVTRAALDQGKHVLCEKPPTMTLKEMEELAELAGTNNLVYSFSRQMRFGHQISKARDLVQEGRLGNVYYARTAWMRPRGIPMGGLRGWFVDREKAGGGAVIDIGIHALDNAWYVLGCPKPLSVSAQVGRYFGHLVPDEQTFDVDDTGFAFIRFEGGLVLHLETSWAANLPASWLPSPDHPERFVVDRGKLFFSTLILGDQGGLRYSPQGTPPLTLASGPGKEITDETFPDLTQQDERLLTFFGRQMEDFVNAVLHQETPINSMTQALDLMRVLDAIYESSANGREVVL